MDQEKQNEEPKELRTEPNNKKVKKSIKGFFNKRNSLILGAVIIVIAIALTFTLWPKHTVSNKTALSTNQSSSTASSSLPTCQGTTLFSQSPIAVDHIAFVSPLGNINSTGGHVIPSDHVSLGLTSEGTAPNQYGIPTNLVAPGNILITTIHAQKVNQNGVENDDYSLFFQPCQQATFYFNHIASLSQSLMSLTETPQAKKSAHCQSGTSGTSFSSSFCDYTVNYKAKAGEVIGIAGGPGEASVGVDFGGYDTRTKPLAYLDTNLKSNALAPEIFHSVCAIDYLPTNVKNQLYTLFGRGPGQQRTAQPLCGVIMQDLAGTIQGNWFVQGSDYGTWTSNLAVVHDNVNPAIGVVSVGGTISTNGGMMQFNPQGTSTVDPEPSQTKQGVLYCFTSNIANQISAYSGEVLMEMTDPQTMKVEHQNGSCQGTQSFVSPTIYSRLTPVQNLTPGSTNGGSANPPGNAQPNASASGGTTVTPPGDAHPNASASN